MKLFPLRLVLLLAIALFVVGCNGKRVGVVNTELVYKESAAAEKGTEYLRNLTNSMQDEVAAIQAKAQDKKNKNAAAEMQQAFMELQQRLNAEQQQVVTALSEMYNKALELCREKYKLDVIIPTEATLSFSPDVDMTKKVMEEMNAMPVSFTPLTAEQPADQSAAQSAEDAAGKTDDATPAQ
ncbi:MAG: hypothetical protein DELT_01680 [Desulfovibrio sp.]